MRKKVRKRKHHLNRYEVLTLICSNMLECKIETPAAISFMNSWREFVRVDKDMPEIRLLQLTLDNQRNFKAWLSTYADKGKTVTLK